MNTSTAEAETMHIPLIIIAPLAVGCRVARQIRNLACVKRRGKTGEYSGTEGSNNFVRGTVTSQHNALDPRPDRAHLPQQRQVFPQHYCRD
jgi:hypothetical protein